MTQLSTLNVNISYSQHQNIHSSKQNHQTYTQPTTPAITQNKNNIKEFLLSHSFTIKQNQIASYNKQNKKKNITYKFYYL